MKKLLILILIFVGVFSHCVHDEYTANVTKHYYNDLNEKRLLQTSGVGQLRIFNDYNNLNSGGTA